MSQNLPPSPMVTPHLSRKHAEELLRLVRRQPQKKWRPVERKLLEGLRRNANGKVYLDHEGNES
jgi:hypothetical protein